MAAGFTGLADYYICSEQVHVVYSMLYLQVCMQARTPNTIQLDEIAGSNKYSCTCLTQRCSMHAVFEWPRESRVLSLVYLNLAPAICATSKKTLHSNWLIRIQLDMILQEQDCT